MMMRASWQVRQAASALSLAAPAGSCSLGDWPTAKTATSATTRIIQLRLNIDLHLIIGVVEIAARIPDGAFGLGAPLAVGGTGQEDVVSALGGLPVVAPLAPGVLGLIFPKLSSAPGGSAVGGDFYF